MYQKTITAIIVLIMVLSVGIGITVASGKEIKGYKATPTLDILPDKILDPNEQELVVGKNWIPNGTVEIDLILPNGNTIKNVVSGIVNTSGDFQVTFTAPNVYGDGYVRAIENSTSLSIHVFYNGNNGGGELSVSWSPQPVYTNETIEFTIEADFLKNKNYVLDVIIFYKDMEVIHYSVLHEGYAIVDTEFNSAGKYFVTFKVEETVYNKTVPITVLWNPNGGGSGGGGGIKVNYTFSVMLSDDFTKATVTIVTDKGYSPSGTLKVINPDGSVSDTKVEGGTAIFDIKNTGTYLLMFKDNKTGDTVTYKYQFNPKVSLYVSPFDKNGHVSISVKVNGKAYNGDLVATITLPDGSNTQVNLNNGEGTYIGKEVGTYKISVSLFGETVSTTTEFDDEPSIENVAIYVSQDLNSLIISGYVYGKISGSPMSGETVTVSSWDLSSPHSSAKTDSSGKFVINIPLTASDRNKKVSLTISCGSSEISESINIPAKLSDFVGWYIAGGIIFILVLIVILVKIGLIKTDLFLSKRGNKNKNPNQLFSYGRGR